MQSSRRNALLIAASTALVLSAETAAMAAVVRAPGDLSSSSNAVWDDSSFAERSFEGLGLVYDILDVTGFYAGGSEVECDDCELSYSPLHESASAFNGLGGIGGAGGGGNGWRVLESKPAAVKGPKPPDTGETTEVADLSHGGAGGSDAPAKTVAAAKEPSSLTTENPGPAQSFVAPLGCTETLSGCQTVDEPTTTGGTTGPGDDGGTGGGAAVVPEPGSMFLLGTGMLGLAAAVRRRVRRFGR